MPFYSATNAADIFAIISNAALLAPSLVAWNRGYIDISVLFFFEAWMSGIFHLCKAFDVCVMGFWTLHQFDFFFATSFIWLAATFLIILDDYIIWNHHLVGRHIELALRMSGLFIVAILQAMTSSDAKISFFSFAALGLLLIYLIAFRLVKHHWPPYDMYYLCLAFEMFALSSTMFLVQNYWPGAYWIIHSDWHVLAAFAWTCLLMARGNEELQPKTMRYIYPVARIKGN